MYKPAIKKEIKEEILARVKGGKDSVATIAKQYGITDGTIYHWLRQGLGGITSQVLSNNRLRKENDALKRIIGELVFERSRKKKG